MRSFCLLFLSLLFPLSLLAQPTISGSVVNARDGQSLAYATIVCYDAQKQLRAATSAPDGKFTLLAGEQPEYRLFVSMVGFVTDTLRVKMHPDGVDLGEVRLREGVQIGEVLVEARRPLFEQRVDRYVYNVADDPDAKRMKMSEMMEKVPMLRLGSQGRLTFQDKAEVQIIVDGQKHELLNQSKQYVMDFLRADVMSQIEIIPPGSAEYNNDKPIVNIKTARRIPNGFAMQLTGGGNTENTWTAGVDFVSKIRDEVVFGMGYSVNFANKPDLHGSMLREILADGVLTETQDNRRTNTSDNLGHSVNLRASTKVFGNNLHVGFNTSFGESNSGSLTELTRTYAAGASKQTQTMQSATAGRAKPRLNADASYLHPVGKSGYNLEYTYRYSDNLSESDSRTLTRFSEDRLNQDKLSLSTTGVREHAARIELRMQSGLRPHRIWANMQYTDRKYDNISMRMRWDALAMKYVPDYSYNDGMNYSQRVLNAAFGYVYFGEKVMLNALLRPSYESSRAVFDSDQIATLRYEKFNLLPRVMVNYRINSKFRTSLGYSMGVVRPEFAKLNPYVDATDSMNLRMGNPALDPERSHDIAFGVDRIFVQGRRAIMFDLLYSRIDKAVEQIVTVDPVSGISTTTYDNVGKRNNFTARLSLWGIVAQKWFNISGVVAYNYVDYASSYAASRSVGAQHAVSVGANVSLPLWKSARLWCNYELRSDIGSPQSGGVNYTHWFRFSIDQTLVKQRLYLYLTLDNPFDSHRYIASSLSGENFRSTSYNERRGRIFGFRLSANFGRFKDKVGSSADLSDDRNRATLPDKRF